MRKFNYMQILPFLFSFLLFFSISLTFLFDGLKDSFLLKTRAESYFEALVNLQNAEQKQLYKKNRPSKKITKKTDSLEKPSFQKPKQASDQKLAKKEENFKACKRIYTCSQLNLYPLLKEGSEKQNDLFILFQRLLKYFYPGFFTEKNSAQNFILQMIQAFQGLLQKDPKADLERLAFEDQNLQLLYYRLIKGSGQKNAGHYPALLDYVKIAKDEKAKICLKKCPLELLAALLGEKKAFQIHQIQKTNELNLKNIQAIFDSEIDPVGYKNNYIISHAGHKKSLLIISDQKKQVFLRKKID